MHPTLDQRTFEQSGGVSKSRCCERELQETGACLCGLPDQLRDSVEHHSSSPGVHFVGGKKRKE